MGSPVTEMGHGSDELQHEVNLSSFLIGKYEVTQSEFMDMFGYNPSANNGSHCDDGDCNGECADGMCPDRPVEGKRWCVLTGASGLQVTTGLKLPTEAQLEYACRAGTTTRFYFRRRDG